MFPLFKSRMQNQRERRESISWKNVCGHARFFHITNSYYFIQLHHIQRYISEKGVQKRVGRDVSKLVTGYDVSRVYREFVLTCSRWQFSSNRLDYAPHLSVFSSPNWLARIAIHATRLCIYVCLI